MKYLYVYKIENLNNGKLYIGCSGDVQKRIFSHKTFLAGGKHTNEELQADYDKGDKFKAAEIFAAGVNDSFDDYIFGCAMRGVEAFYTVTLNTDLNGYNKKHVGGWRKREEAEICFPDLDGLSAEMRKHAAAFRRYGWGGIRGRAKSKFYMIMSERTEHSQQQKNAKRRKPSNPERGEPSPRLFFFLLNLFSF